MSGGRTPRVTWEQALAWRMRRQLLDPIGSVSVPDVVRRLCGVQAQVASTAELGVRVRRRTSRVGEVGKALSEGLLIKTWAMRGSLHLLTPEDGGAFLSLIAAARPWERPSWQRYFGLTTQLLDELREAAREALSGPPLSREELVAAVSERPALRSLRQELLSGWGTLLKPLAWQGELCFGPSRAGRVTFTRPNVASRHWAGVPEVEAAAPAAMAAYLGAYGPATVESVGNWLSGGWFGKRQLRGWFASLGERLAEVEVDGEQAFLLAEHLDELMATKASSTVRLLPGFDQYVLGPGTADPHVIPPARRRDVSRQSGWIAPIVVAGGVVRGTWALDAGELRVGWFGEAGRPPAKALDAEVARLASIIGRDVRLAVTVA